MQKDAERCKWQPPDKRRPRRTPRATQDQPRGRRHLPGGSARPSKAEEKDGNKWLASLFVLFVLYVLYRDERHVNIRAFSDKMKREAYERQKRVCPKCKKKFDLSEMEADHIKPWREGGKTNAANCQMLCKDDNRRKSGR